MTPEQLNLNNVQCNRCGNCCPARTCAHFERQSNVATCKDHSNNHQRIGCSRPPIELYSEGIACKAVEEELQKMGLFQDRAEATTSSGQVIYTDSEFYQLISKSKK